MNEHRRFDSGRLRYAAVAAVITIAVAWVLFVRTDDSARVSPGADAAAGSGAPPEAGGPETTTRAGTPDAVVAGAGDAAAAAAPAARAGAIETGTAGGDEDGPVPIPIPPEHVAALERNDQLRAFHDRLEREPRNAAWALALERDFAEFLRANFDLSKFIVHSIECRSDSCELLVTGYGDDAFRNWLDGTARMFEAGKPAAWGDDGLNAGCGGANVAPGVFALNCTFARAVPEPVDGTPAELPSIEAPYPPGVTVERVAVADLLVPLIESKPEVYALHRRLEAEPRDVGWADFIETQVAAYFAELAETGSLTIVGSQCRTTLCEVQMTVADRSGFNDALIKLLAFQSEPWHDLGTVDMNGGELEASAMGLVWLLERRRGE